MNYCIVKIMNTMIDKQEEHILHFYDAESYSSFPADGEGSEAITYREWVKKGNTAEEWSPQWKPK